MWRPTPHRFSSLVTLLSPDEQEFSGRALEETLAWRLVWLMAPELGIGPYAA